MKKSQNNWMVEGSNSKGLYMTNKKAADFAFESSKTWLLGDILSVLFASFLKCL